MNAEEKLAKYIPVPLRAVHSFPNGVKVILAQNRGSWELFYIALFGDQEYGRGLSELGALRRASARWRKERKGEPDPFQSPREELLGDAWRNLVLGQKRAPPP